MLQDGTEVPVSHVSNSMTFTDWEEGCSELRLAQRVLRQRTCQEVGFTGFHEGSGFAL